MKEKNTLSVGKGRLASVMFLLMIICLVISFNVTIQGCGQVSSDTVMQCYGCIQSLQEAISSALQEENEVKVGTRQPITHGKASQWGLSRKDLTTLDQTLRGLMKLESLRKLLPTDTTTSYSVSNATEAEKELQVIYDEDLK